jgi:hypothetical protein
MFLSSMSYSPILDKPLSFAGNLIKYARCSWGTWKVATMHAILGPDDISKQIV